MSTDVRTHAVTHTYIEKKCMLKPCMHTHSQRITHSHTDMPRCTQYTEAHKDTTDRHTRTHTLITNTPTPTQQHTATHAHTAHTFVLIVNPSFCHCGVCASDSLAAQLFLQWGRMHSWVPQPCVKEKWLPKNKRRNCGDQKSEHMTL